MLLLPSGTYQRHRLRVLSQIFKLLDKKEPPHDEVSDLMKSLALCFYCLRVQFVRWLKTRWTSFWDPWQH